MKKSLPARPNLEHLRTQAKQLLSDLRAGDAAAARTFIEHLPAAGRMTPEKVLRAGFRLADAQSAIARQSGFAAWPGLARHVEQLRSFEGEWEFVSLEIDGSALKFEERDGRSNRGASSRECRTRVACSVSGRSTRRP